MHIIVKGFDPSRLHECMGRDRRCLKALQVSSWPQALSLFGTRCEQQHQGPLAPCPSSSRPCRARTCVYFASCLALLLLPTIHCSHAVLLWLAHSEHFFPEISRGNCSECAKNFCTHTSGLYTSTGGKRKRDPPEDEGGRRQAIGEREERRG